MNSPEAHSRSLPYAWVVVALLFPVALLNYLDRQMIASMRGSVQKEISLIQSTGSADVSKPTASGAVGDTPSPEPSTEPQSIQAELRQVKANESVENTNWGHMLAQFKWVYAFFSPIGGYLADRLSRRLTICASLAAWSLITVLTGTVTTYEGLLWTRTLMGVSEAFYIPSALAMIADYHQGTTRSKAIGFHQMGMYIGMIVGGFSGYAADSPWIGWRSAFKWIGLLGIAYALPLVIMLRDKQRELAPLPAEVGTTAGLGERLRQMLGGLASMSFLLLVLYFTLPAMAGWVFRDWMPWILKEAFPKLSQGLAGVTAIIWQVAAIGAAILGGVWADRWIKSSSRGRIFVSAIGMSLLIPALVIMGYAVTYGAMVPAIVALLMFGIGWGLFDCNNMPILCQIVRPEFRATGYGIMNFVSIFCGGIADKQFGVFKDKAVPLLHVFGLFSVICLVSVVLVLSIRPQLSEKN